MLLTLNFGKFMKNIIGNKRIAIVYSLPTQRVRASSHRATDEDTVSSANEVYEALKSCGAQAVLVPVDEFSLEKIKTISADCIFNLIEWDGLDFPLAVRAFTLIHETNTVVTGATVENLLCTNDKFALKQAFDKENIPTAPWQVFVTGKETVRDDFHFPVILKPSLEHCSVGLTYDAICSTPRELKNKVVGKIREFSQPVIAEEYIDGIELQVTLLVEDGAVRMLPPAQIVFNDTPGLNFLTYESRWNESHPEYARSTVALAHLPDSVYTRLEHLTIRVFRALGYRDYARCDIRLRGDDIFFLEVNSNPGLGDEDEYGMTVSYRAVGMTFADFVCRIVESALRRYHSTDRFKQLAHTMSRFR